MKLRNLFTGKKRNILLVSEGGSGKSSCVLDAFLFFAQNYERYRMIPVYLPLNSLENTENPVYHFFGAAYTGTTSKTVLHDHLSKSKNSYLFLADGLNELPNTDNTFRQNVICDILDLSELPNVSAVVVSRYREIRLADFEQYELSGLNTEIVQSKVPDYRLLSNDMKTLLSTPFNLCLYLSLIEQYRTGKIRTSGDLIFANINMLRNKLYKNGYRKILIDFLFDAVLPVVAYRMCQNNEWSFSYAALTDTAAYYSDLLKRESAYGEVCRLIQAQPELIPVIFREMILDNAIVYTQDVDEYAFVHEQYRDLFGAVGWIFTVEHFKRFYEKEGEDLQLDCSAPVCAMDYIMEMIAKEESSIPKREMGIAKTENWFNALFDKTTRGMKNSPAAARFNKSIIDFIGLKDKFYCHDFRDLNLTMVDFSNSKFWFCDFSGAVLNEKAFSSPTSKEPIGVWNNDNISLVFFGEGFLRCVSIHTGKIELIKTPEFNAFFVQEPFVYLYKDRVTTKSNHDGKNILIGEVYTLELFRWNLICHNLLRVPKKVLLSHKEPDGSFYYLFLMLFFDKQPKSRHFLSRRITELDVENNTFSCRLFMMDEEGRTFVLTKNAVYCFSETECVFIQSLSYRSLASGNNDNSLERTWKIIGASATGKTIVLENHDFIRPDDSRSFVVLKTDNSNKNAPLRAIGYFDDGLFSEYGDVKTIIPSDDALLVCVEDYRSVSLVRFFPATGNIEKDDDIRFIKRCTDKTHAMKRYPVSSQSGDYHQIIAIVCDNRVFCVNPYIPVAASKNFISVFDSNCLSLLSFLPDKQELLPLMEFVWKNSADDYDYYLQNHWKHDSLLLCKNTYELEYHIDRRTLSVIDQGSALRNLPEGHDEISFSLIGAEQYQYSNRYLKEVDLRRFDPEQDDVNCFHGLVDGYLDDGKNDIKISLMELSAWLSWGNPVCDWMQSIKRTGKTETNLFYIYQRKFGKAVAGRGASLIVMHFFCVYHRFIIAVCMSECFSNIVFLILDLKSNKLKRIDTEIPAETENNIYSKIIVWNDTGEDFDGCHINHLFYIADKTLFELSLDLKKRTYSVVHETMLFPFVWLQNCRFLNAEVYISEARQEELTRQGKSIEAEKRRILDSWKENVIYDKLPEERR